MIDDDFIDNARSRAEFWALDGEGYRAERETATGTVLLSLDILDLIGEVRELQHEGEKLEERIWDRDCRINGQEAENARLKKRIQKLEDGIVRGCDAFDSGKVPTAELRAVFVWLRKLAEGVK